MSNTYTTISYLTPESLNDIENRIKDLTNDIQDEIFEGQSNSLMSVWEDDNLSGITLRLSFPRTAYQNINNTEEIDILTTSNGYKISYVYDEANERKAIYLKKGNYIEYLYSRITSYGNNPNINRIKIRLPYDMGVVTECDVNNTFHGYIKFYEYRDVIPNYTSRRYSTNQIPDMKKIDNIEQGIKNIGDYYYKPIGWETTKTWLNDYGTNMKNLSYQDLNRWINNLNLINFDDIDKLNLWNTIISHVVWDTPYEQEWEEL